MIVALEFGESVILAADGNVGLPTPDDDANDMEGDEDAGDYNKHTKVYLLYYF